MKVSFVRFAPRSAAILAAAFLPVLARADAYTDATGTVSTALTGLTSVAVALVGLTVAIWAVMKIRSMFGK